MQKKINTSQQIAVIEEPSQINTYWHRITMDSVRLRVQQKKKDLLLISEDDLDSLDAEYEPIVVISGTQEWLDRILAKLETLRFRCVLLSTSEQVVQPNVSVITIDRARAIKQAVSYLHDAHRKRIAFFAYYPNSLNDQQKLEAFSETYQELGIEFSNKDVFPFDGDIQQTLVRFIEKCESYNAVICANDIAGVLLLQSETLRSKIHIPDDLYVISFGDMILSRIIHTSLTSFTLDYTALGTTAVDTVDFLRKRRYINAQTTVVRSILRVGASTAYHSFREPSPKRPVTDFSAASVTDPFYKDEPISSLLALEAFLNRLDLIDIRILLMQMQGMQQQEILDVLFISDSTYRYRLRKMRECLGIASSDALVKHVAEIVDLEQFVSINCNEEQNNSISDMGMLR